MSPKVSQEHKEQRRAKLIEAAAEVFIENGYETATMKHVMDKAGVSRGGLYQYFENKEDLFREVIQGNQEKIIDGSLEKLIKQQSSYWDVLLVIMLGDKKESNDKMDPLSPSKLEYFVTRRNDEKRREYARLRYFDAFEMTTKIIERGETAGEFIPRFPIRLIAKSIISYIDGLALGHAILDSRTLELKEQTTLLLNYLKWALGVEEE
ncbi:TetR/AcrR family transcriptional regulator [Rossellomorea vietnamensis]|uniref:TetR/AcrR family transcriptional regulator n=1 Tax=Rossellomorea vietnamensis TaxID=218284 RepID=A0A5D4NYG1_9BACI|nr:TetR/AcrR family transcriptional regulator [Rossellomorea vietnamensis]TYS18771.1 TetR/AcrR family transcriptional regulator [Rossellomorea vietnamensis]